MSKYEDYAFPTSQENNDGSVVCANGRGMTQRAYFASQAMIGLLAHPEVGANGEVEIAKIAVRQAHALIAELNETD